MIRFVHLPLVHTRDGTTLGVYRFNVAHIIAYSASLHNPQQTILKTSEGASFRLDLPVEAVDSLIGVATQ